MLHGRHLSRVSFVAFCSGSMWSSVRVHVGVHRNVYLSVDTFVDTCVDIFLDIGVDMIVAECVGTHWTVSSWRILASFSAART